MLSANSLVEKAYLNQFAALSVYLNNITQLQYYIDQGADINALILKVVKLGNQSMLHLLLKLGANVGVLDKHNMIPIEIAAKYKQWDMMKILLDYPQKNDIKEAYSFALSIVAVYNQIDIAELLVKMGADPDTYESLKRAIIGNTKPEKMLKLLISAGADLNRRDALDNLTPLDIAIKYKKADCIKLLNSYLNQIPDRKLNPHSFFPPPVLIGDQVLADKKMDNPGFIRSP